LSVVTVGNAGNHVPASGILIRKKLYNKIVFQIIMDSITPSYYMKDTNMTTNMIIHI